MRGVSSSVMCGQYGNYGTGAFNIVLDMDEMVKLEETVIDVTNATTEIEKMFGTFHLNNQQTCSKNKIEVHNNIANIKKIDTGVCDNDYDMGL